MKYSLITLVALFIVNISYAQIQKVEISSDGIQLNAYMYQAEGDGLKPTIVWCHGNPGGKEEGTSKFALKLNDKNINILRFNYRGLWDTEGVYTLANCQRDLKNVLDFVLSKDKSEIYKIDTSRIIVAGYSQGANIAIVSALYDDRIKEVFCLGLGDLSYIARQFFNYDNPEMKKITQMALDGIWGGITSGQGDYARDFDKYVMDILFNNYKYDFVVQADKLKDKRIYLIVGMNDLTGPIEEHFFPLYRKLKAMNHNDFKYDITMSDHSFSELYDGRLSEMIAQWIHEK